MGIFTFGRAHELKCAVTDLRDPAQKALMAAVIDAAHDLLEGKVEEAVFIDACRTGFLAGKRAVWDRTESWIRKFSGQYPAVLRLWPEFASHADAEIRWRVACVLYSLPGETFAAVSGPLADDKSKLVAEMARARIDEVREREAK